MINGLGTTPRHGWDGRRFADLWSKGCPGKWLDRFGANIGRDYLSRLKWIPFVILPSSSSLVYYLLVCCLAFLTVFCYGLNLKLSSCCESQGLGSSSQNDAYFITWCVVRNAAWSWGIVSRPWLSNCYYSLKLRPQQATVYKAREQISREQILIRINKATGDIDLGLHKSSQ